MRRVTRLGGCGRGRCEHGDAAIPEWWHAGQSRRGVAVGLGWRGGGRLCQGHSVQTALQKGHAAGRFVDAT
jgi:hypothetical protein